MKTIKYCFLCSGKFLRKSDNLLVCSRCKFHCYENPKPTNAAILVNMSGEILLVKRAIEPKKGLWDLPGGFINNNETAEKSIRREIKEELNIGLRDLEYFGSYPDKYLYQEVNLKTLCFIFVSNIDTSKFKTEHEISEFKFFKPNEIPFEKIGFLSIKIALKKFTADKK